MNIKFNINSQINKDLTVEQFKKVLFLSMLKLHELSVQKCPVDTSRLKNSLNIKPFSPGYSEYTFSDGTDYGVDVEFGTKPHYVSPKELEGWSKRVLKDKNAAFAVSNAIGKRGTEAQPFMRPSLDQVNNVWVKRYVSQLLSKDKNI